MPSIEFSVYCDTCNAGICNSTTVTNDRNGVRMSVEACDKCVSKARDEGYDEGYAEGKREGYDDGYDKGYADGITRGMRME